MRKVKFNKAFASKKKGDTLICDSQLANQLVRVDKVATYADKKGETDTEIKAERKEELEKKVIEKITLETETKFMADFEEQFRQEIEDGKQEEFIKSVKTRILTLLTAELNEEEEDK